MSTPTPFALTLASLLVAVAVGLSGTHAKDIATITMPHAWRQAKQKSDETGQQPVKVTVELHHHSDGSAKVQYHQGDGHQADSRSLRLLHHKKTAMSQRRHIDSAEL